MKNKYSKSELILNGSLIKAVWTLSLPIIASNLIQTLYNLTDMYFVSKLGEEQMAAMQITYPVIFFMISIAMGLSIGGVALISQHIGSNDKYAVRKTAGQVISISLLIAFIIGAMGYYLARPILYAMNARGDLLQYGVTYMQIIFLGLPTMFLTFAYTSIRQGEGDTFTPMIINVLSVVTNIVLDPIFIFFFGLGMAGAAYATVLARGFFNFVAIYLLFSKKHNSLGLKLKDLKIDFKYLKPLVKVAIPASIGQAMTALGFIVMNGFVLVLAHQS